MEIKKEWKNLKRGYSELQRKRRKAQAQGEARQLQKLKVEKTRQEARAWRVKQISEHRKKIAKANATISKRKKAGGKSGFSKTASWLFVDANPKRKAPTRRSPVKSSAKYIVKNGIAYPVARKKTMRSKPQAKPKQSLMDEYDGLLR